MFRSHFAISMFTLFYLTFASVSLSCGKNVERMDDYRMARRVLIAEVSGGRGRRRPRLGWIDGVKVALGNRGMTVEAARQCAKDRKAWRAM